MGHGDDRVAGRMQLARHSDHVLQQLCCQLEYGFLCDCSITVGDVHFRAHRVVLAACSSYFHKLFVNQPGEASQVCLSSQAVSPDHFDLILQLMYTGRLVSLPSDPDQFRASLNFLKLYGAPRFSAGGSEEAAVAPPQVSEGGKGEPLVFGVELRPWDRSRPEDTTEQQQQQQHQQQLPVTVKSETPEGPWGEGVEGPPSPPRLCCPLCGLAFEQPRGLQEHLPGCLRGRGQGWGAGSGQGADPRSPTPEVKQEAPERRWEGDGGLPEEQGAGGMKRLKVEAPEQEEVGTPGQGNPLLLELSGITVVRVGGGGEPEAGVSPGLGPPEDYELEEGEVRFPGDDDLVLENPEDDDDDDEGSFSSSSEGEGSTSSSDSPSPVPSEDEGRPRARVPGRAWSCQACCPAEGRAPARSQTKAQGKAECARAPSQCCRTESGVCHARPNGRQQPSHPGWERTPVLDHALSRGAVPGRGKKGQKAAKQSRAPGHKKGTEAGQGKQQQRRRPAKTVTSGPGKHSGPRKHSCQICGKAFLQRGHLAEHTATHSEVGRFTCRACGQEFPRELELRLHATTHAGDSRYACRLCGQGSYRKHGHLRHMASHLSRGQVLCRVCFEIFRGAPELERHLESHLYPCGTCGEKFKRKKDAAAHSTSCWMKKLMTSELDRPSNGQRNVD
ncbi:uncharacterized protein [Chiloscyllium punctatum]|uniref:uncharacterized protein isoform X1 n=2 Tax=Chiloscyllium punctatum TaxID=137246 RepID=UPI003B635F65